MKRNSRIFIPFKCCRSYTSLIHHLSQNQLVIKNNEIIILSWGRGLDHIYDHSATRIDACVNNYSKSVYIDKVIKAMVRMRFAQKYWLGQNLGISQHSNSLKRGSFERMIWIDGPTSKASFWADWVTDCWESSNRHVKRGEGKQLLKEKWVVVTNHSFCCLFIYEVWLVFFLWPCSFELKGKSLLRVKIVLGPWGAWDGWQLRCIGNLPTHYIV